MANLNRVFIIGNCTRDPEMRYTPKGVALAEIGVAVNRTWKSETGDKQQETTFIDCTLWGRLAEIAGQYLKKGSPCMIEGRLQMDTWDDKQTGQKRSKLKVIAEHLQLLGSRSESDASSSAPPRPSGSTRTLSLRAGTGGDEPDDIPYGCDRG
jgi:single-strand DNA-binding protein